MNRSEMKEMFGEERSELEYDINIVNDSIESFQIELTRITKFVNLLDKLPGSLLIKNIDRGELYDLRNYYYKLLNNVTEILIEKEKYLKKLNDQLNKLSKIQMYL